MTEEELVVIDRAIHSLNIALMGKTTKISIQALVWQAREDLRKLTKTNLGEAKNVQHERECGR